MSETLTMSTKERQRLQVLGHLKHGKTTVVKAAAALGISERQMYRVLDRYRCQGDPGLIHRSRGRASNRGYDPEIRTEALRLHRELYPDYGPTLFAEMLQQYHQLTIDADTLRRWLKAGGSVAGDPCRAPTSSEARTTRCHRCHGAVRRQLPRVVRRSWTRLLSARGDRRCLRTGLYALCRVRERLRRPGDAQDLCAAVWHSPRVLRGFWLCLSRQEEPADRCLTGTLASRASTSSMPTLPRPRVASNAPTVPIRIVSSRPSDDTTSPPSRMPTAFLEKTYLQEHNARFARADHLPDIHRSAEGIDLNNIFCFETTRYVNRRLHHHAQRTLHSTPEHHLRHCRHPAITSPSADGSTAHSTSSGTITNWSLDISQPNPNHNPSSILRLHPHIPGGPRSPDPNETTSEPGKRHKLASQPKSPILPT